MSRESMTQHSPHHYSLFSLHLLYLGTGDPCRFHATASRPYLLRSLIKSLSSSSSSLYTSHHGRRGLFGNYFASNIDRVFTACRVFSFPYKVD